MTAESRSVVVRLSMEAAQYIRDAQRVGTVTSDAMSTVEKSTDKAGAAIDGLGEKAGKVALGAAGGLAAMGKAAIDWESQWAGVTKTVDGTSAQLGQLEGDLRGLAKTLPATHEEIAGVAEAAGQLGVKRQDIADFTKTMIDLGETTNLTAEDAATNIAQIANVMGTAGDEVDNFGASLVALGNAGASTEAQILDMTQRIAGAGAQIGLTESDILAIANAAASMGIEAEAGGSAISRVFTELAKATKQGGAALDDFAGVAGMSSGAFVKAFQADPARAFASFTQGLDRINKSGGDVFTTLDQLGLSDVRVSQALLGMAASGDLLTDSLDLGAKAWEENTALAAEAEKRYDTTASKVQVAWNQIKDAGIEAGAALLPVIADIAEAVGTAADAFGALPDPVQGAVTGLLAITAVVGGAAFFGAKVIGGIASTRAQLRLLTAEGTRSAAVLSRVGTAASGIGKLKAAALLGGIAVASTGAADGIGLTNTASLALMGTLAGPWGAAVGGGVGLVLDLADSQDVLATAIGGANKALDSQNIALLEQELRRLTEAREELLDFDPGTFASIISSAAQFDPGQIDRQLAEIDAKRREIQGRIGEIQIPGGQGVVDPIILGPLGDIAGAAAVTEAAIKDLSEELEHLNAVLSGRASWRDYESAIDAVGTALKENGKTLDITTEAGRDNQAALDSIASTAVKVAENLKGVDQARFLQRARKDFIAAAESLGLLPKQAQALADKLGLVDKKKTKPKVDADIDPALAKLQELDPLLNGLAGRTVVPDVDVNTQKGRDELARFDPILNGFDKTVTPKVDVETGQAQSELSILQQAINKLTGKTIYISTVTTQRHLPAGTTLAQQAFGGFYPRHFADGGMDRANGHQPEIARGGAWRVWAEPETQGETYIPHANDRRRPAAKRYLEQTANLFGGRVEWFADGGATISRSGGRVTVDASGISALGREAKKSAEEIRKEQKERKEHIAEMRKERVDAARDRLRDVRGERNQLAGSVADRFKSDPFAAPDNIWASGAGDINAILRGDIADARAFSKAGAQLRKKGLGGAAFAELAQNADLATIQALARGPRANIQQYERLFNVREKVTASAGRMAGNTVYSAQISRLETKLDALVKATKDGPKEFGKALNGAARTGVRRGTR